MIMHSPTRAESPRSRIGWRAPWLEVCGIPGAVREVPERVGDSLPRPRNGHDSLRLRVGAADGAAPRVYGVPPMKVPTLATEPRSLPAWLDLTSRPIYILTYRDAFRSAHASLGGAIREAQARQGARRLDIVPTAPPEAFVWRDRRAGLWEIKRVLVDT